YELTPEPCATLRLMRNCPPAGPHPTSLPRGNPGYSCSPVRGFVGPRYSLRTASTCPGVRHVGASAPAHCNTPGSNAQTSGLVRKGSEGSPPPFPAHCRSTALLMSGSFAIDRLCSVPNVTTPPHTSASICFVQSFAASPATTPS